MNRSLEKLFPRCPGAGRWQVCVWALIAALALLGLPIHGECQAKPRAVLLNGFVSSEGPYRSAETALDGIEKRLASQSITVIRFRYPYADLPEVGRALNGAKIVIYEGHGVILGQNCIATDSYDVGGMKLGDYLVRPEELRRTIRLAPNAWVFLPCSCFAAGNSCEDVGKVSRHVLEKRMAVYAQDFIECGASFVLSVADPMQFIDALNRTKNLEAAYSSVSSFGRANVCERAGLRIHYLEESKVLSTRSALVTRADAGNGIMPVSAGNAGESPYVAVSLAQVTRTTRPAAARRTVTTQAIPPKTPSGDGKRDEGGENIVSPMIFPVAGKVSWTDTFGAPRDGGKRKHAGQDLMAPQMRPLLACFDGTVSFHRDTRQNGHNMLFLRGENGWSATYMHINNDTPGTDDEAGSQDYAYPAGLNSGDHVKAGQLIAFCGNSGNARYVGPHCHFELYGPSGLVNAAPSLRAAQHLSEPRGFLPNPEARPEAGEIRLDGVVRSIDSASGIAVLDMIAWTYPGGKTTPITKPVRQWVSLPGSAPVRAIGDTDSALSAADFSVGMQVIVIGADRGKDHAVIARTADIGRQASLETARAERRRVIAEEIHITPPQIEPRTEVAERPQTEDTPFRPAPPAAARERPESPAAKPTSVVFEDFEGNGFYDWVLTGNCWGSGPMDAHRFGGRMPGSTGRRYINTFEPDGASTGTATSPKFVLHHRAIHFRIGGANLPDLCCLRLLIDGKPVRSQTGNDKPALEEATWDVSDLQGREATLQIVDMAGSRRFGYIMIDQIVFDNNPEDASSATPNR